MIEVVCGFVLNTKNEVLITQRGDKENLYKWEFPGGKVEDGEVLSDSLKRELKEELGIEVKPFEVLFESEYRNFKLLFIKCHFTQGIVTLNEHIDYKWIEKNKLKNFDFLEGDKEFVNYILK
jgi:8-oxo-dGTP diphosphatase